MRTNNLQPSHSFLTTYAAIRLTLTTMKLLRTIISIACIATAAVAVAAPRQAIDVDTIKDKVSITLGQQLHIKFAADGDRLLHPKSVERAGDHKATVEIKLHVTDSTPFAVRGVPTRPFLVVSNGFERPLRYRALARLKGSREFLQISTEGEPVAPGDQSTKCWESGSLVEEVVLYQFALLQKPSK